MLHLFSTGQVGFNYIFRVYDLSRTKSRKRKRKDINICSTISRRLGQMIGLSDFLPPPLHLNDLPIPRHEAFRHLAHLLLVPFGNIEMVVALVADVIDNSPVLDSLLALGRQDEIDAVHAQPHRWPQWQEQSLEKTPSGASSFIIARLVICL